MPLFFFLSGLLCKRELSKESIKYDLRYLILPYFTYGIIFIVFGLIRLRIIDFVFMFNKLEALFYGFDAGIGPIWFLPALFFCKQLFLLVKLLKHHCLIVYYLFLVLSFLPAYFISCSKLNFPFFIDSALCGLPFFFIGNESFRFLMKLSSYKVYFRTCFACLGFLISIPLCFLNGYVIFADCIIGKSVLLYYINAFALLFSVILFSTVISKIRYNLVTVVSYGSMVVLGFHGIFLTLFNYYLPLLLGMEPSTYSIIYGLLFSIITIILCYILIILIDGKCLFLFGLKV